VFGGRSIRAQPAKNIDTSSSVAGPGFQAGVAVASQEQLNSFGENWRQQHVQGACIPAPEDDAQNRLSKALAI